MICELAIGNLCVLAQYFCKPVHIPSKSQPMKAQLLISRVPARRTLFKSILLGIALLAAHLTSAQAQERYRFRNPESERRYNEARRDQQRYESERAYHDGYARELERRDRFFAPIRRGADAAFNAGSRFVPRWGGPMRQAYNRGMNHYRGR